MDIHCKLYSTNFDPIDKNNRFKDKVLPLPEQLTLLWFVFHVIRPAA